MYNRLNSYFVIMNRFNLTLFYTFNHLLSLYSNNSNFISVEKPLTISCPTLHNDENLSVRRKKLKT